MLLVVFRRKRRNTGGNPLEPRAAPSFGALLAVIMILGEALKAWLGEAGVLMLAGASGVAEVDAITLSLARMSRGESRAGRRRHRPGNRGRRQQPPQRRDGRRYRRETARSTSRRTAPRGLRRRPAVGMVFDHFSMSSGGAARPNEIYRESRG